jgi:hypothetical protein
VSYNRVIEHVLEEDKHLHIDVGGSSTGSSITTTAAGGRAESFEIYPPHAAGRKRRAGTGPGRALGPHGSLGGKMPQMSTSRAPSMARR